MHLTLLAFVTSLMLARPEGNKHHLQVAPNSPFFVALTFEQEQSHIADQHCSLIIRWLTILKWFCCIFSAITEHASLITVSLKCLMISLMESSTKQVDNLVLPLFAYVTFLIPWCCHTVTWRDDGNASWNRCQCEYFHDQIETENPDRLSAGHSFFSLLLIWSLIDRHIISIDYWSPP